ncbi:MAG: DUF5063 domain-containing protein [Planctomycetes bacterium]|nr:DUF5063 domain-containing protein [Planctomycetota bacterium]HPF13033.1 DUF5063 domain-containing protein [Planctomycetota bacterium]HRV83078.1 DUF5063 domain-containing protein [Planctomycetota bacterium]
MTPLDRFASTAATYCEWCRSTPADPRTEAQQAFELLAKLQQQAEWLHVSKDAQPAFQPAPASEAARQAVIQRARALPFQNYEHLATPKKPARNPRAAQSPAPLGDIAEDLAKIYTDLAAGLDCFTHAHRDQAEHIWRSRYNSSWGQPARDAGRVLGLWLGRAN